MGYFPLNEFVSTARLFYFYKIEALANPRSALILGFCAVFAIFTAAVRFGSIRLVPSVFVCVYYLRMAPLILHVLSGDS